MGSLESRPTVINQELHSISFGTDREKKRYSIDNDNVMDKAEAGIYAHRKRERMASRVLPL